HTSLASLNMSHFTLSPGAGSGSEPSGGGASGSPCPPLYGSPPLYAMQPLHSPSLSGGAAQYNLEACFFSPGAGGGLDSGGPLIGGPSAAPAPRLHRDAGHEGGHRGAVSGVRRQSQRLPLRPPHLRVLQGIFQKDRPEQESVHMRRRAPVSYRQNAKETLPVLPFPEVPRSWN
ncbi:unnamed protein product, partial [Nesidiocoris tenuis]